MHFLLKNRCVINYFYYLCVVLRRLRPLWTWVGEGQDIYKGVYYALVLTP